MTRRPARPADEPFLRALDASYREHRFAALEPEARAQMLDLQYRARRSARVHATEEVVERDGEPVGAVVYETGGDGVHVLDLVLVPEARNQGIGAAVLEEVAAGRPVRLAVEAANVAARRFYERLGFTPTGDDGVSITLRRAAGPPSR